MLLFLKAEIPKTNNNRALTMLYVWSKTKPSHRSQSCADL